ncbi:hypothetical protein GCM10010215_70170 [Streptomyces virginiae]|uniref:Uncharacterized protein n=1 Tax=Streptomyces virginiae TaxID=1961 RepID=A0ABQ3NYU4_STRVG|nr:hypothetical protein GCM10010215_70170 [Streptomyces virginiae]GHI17934.1 hypothetical protein Scinn_73970 [Streptomyces virginiae]GLV90473.1 hypothetical protein Slala04_19270 [Streptomyces lavendulae subsp. lavendulae]
MGLGKRPGRHNGVTCPAQPDPAGHFQPRRRSRREVRGGAPGSPGAAAPPPPGRARTGPRTTAPGAAAPAPAPVPRKPGAAGGTP